MGGGVPGAPRPGRGLQKPAVRTHFPLRMDSQPKKWRERERQKKQRCIAKYHFKVLLSVWCEKRKGEEKKNEMNEMNYFGHKQYFVH